MFENCCEWGISLIYFHVNYFIEKARLLRPENVLKIYLTIFLEA